MDTRSPYQDVRNLESSVECIGISENLRESAGVCRALGGFVRIYGDLWGSVRPRTQ